MTIIYFMHDDGGFRCADTETGITSYAYGTSTAADCAKRKPKIAARRMLRDELRTIPRADYDARNLRILAECDVTEF